MRRVAPSSALLAGLAGLAACALPADDPLARGERAVIGGEEVAAGDYPAVLALSDGRSLCTATLIHPEWVLTAAHCVDPVLQERESIEEVADATFVILDDVDVVDADPGEVVELTEVFLHPEWDLEALGDNDIAVVKLASPITDRAPIPVRRTPVEASGTPILQVGFGVSNTDPEPSGSGVLRELSTETLACATFGMSDDTLLCMGADDGDGICFGDSGGPTFVGEGAAREVAGVASFVANDACTGFNAVSRVDQELDFIDEHVPAIADEPEDEGGEGEGGGEGDDGAGDGAGGGGAPTDDGPGSGEAIAGGCSAAPFGHAPSTALLLGLALVADLLRRRHAG